MKNSLAPSIVTARDPKGLKFVSIVEAAYNKAGLSDEEAQRVNDAPGLSDLVANYIAEHRSPNEFKNEEIGSSYGYLSGYKPSGLTSQTNRLRELLPGLGFPDQRLLGQIDRGEVKLPKGAEGWFAIPNIWKNGGLPSIGATYSECVQKVLDLVKKTRDGAFQNYRDGSIDEKHLRQLAKSKATMEAISEAQGNMDILIIAAQFGKRHAGRSTRRARAIMSSVEFGLGAFASGCMILTHPKRLQHFDDLWIDCAGDEFSPDGDGKFSYAPYFSFNDVKVKFGTDYVGNARDYYGSASGFVPQY